MIGEEEKGRDRTPNKLEQRNGTIQGLGRNERRRCNKAKVKKLERGKREIVGDLNLVIGETRPKEVPIFYMFCPTNARQKTEQPKILRVMHE